jgi:hypothetical protein
MVTHFEKRNKKKGKIFFFDTDYISGTNSSHGQGGKERKDPNLLSLVLFTNRSGAWDIALHSLAAQTSRNYELKVVDDTKADRRNTAIYFYLAVVIYRNTFFVLFFCSSSRNG